MLTSSKEVRTENTYESNTGYLASTKHNTTNAGGNVVYNFDYDALGRQKSVSVGSAVLSTTAYNELLGTVANVTYGNTNDPVGSVHYQYDGFGRVTGIRYDNETGDRFSYGYDACQQVSYVTDNVRNVTVYTDYDLAGRPCLKTHLAGTAHAYTGKLTYNDYELPNSFTEYVGANRTKYTTGFGYDIENRVTALTYGTGSVSYAYDKLGRITTRTLKPASTNIATTYTYLAGGQGTNSTTGLIQKITQGGVTLTYTYDDNGNITQVKTGSLYTKYTYNKIGELTRVNDQTDLTAGSTGTTWAFTYDLGGNIKTKKAYAYTTGSLSGLDPTESHTYTYGSSAWKDKLTKFDGTTITYDSIGNPLNDGTWQYTWQHGKQLQQMQKTEDGITTTVQFEYNEDGLRTKKTVVSGNSTTVTEYILHGKNVVHMTRGSDELHFYYDAQNRPAIVIFNGTAYGYLYNLQGDVVALVDGSGTKVVEYTYDAWGKPTGKTGTMATTLGTVQPFRYRGYVFDEETGLYYLRSRYFKPEWERFVIADVLIKGNLYRYCENSPVMEKDKNGKESSNDFYQYEVYGYIENSYLTDEGYHVNYGMRVRILSYKESKGYAIRFTGESGRIIDCYVPKSVVIIDTTYSRDRLTEDMNQLSSSTLSMEGKNEHKRKTKILQMWLNQFFRKMGVCEGNMLLIDGSYDYTTMYAVQKAQKLMNTYRNKLLLEDGKFGNETLEALYCFLYEDAE